MFNYYIYISLCLHVCTYIHNYIFLSIFTYIENYKLVSTIFQHHSVSFFPHICNILTEETLGSIVSNVLIYVIFTAL